VSSSSSSKQVCERVGVAEVAPTIQGTVALLEHVVEHMVVVRKFT